jgi:hypothetical protein
MAGIDGEEREEVKKEKVISDKPFIIYDCWFHI